MQKTTKNNRGKCPVAYLLDLVGDKWTLLVIRDLMFKQKKHYGDFMNSPESISTNILADRLAKLEENGLVEKLQDETNLARFVYRLTNKGKDLLPMMLEMIAWSAKHDEAQVNAPDSIVHGAPAKLLKRMRTDRKALLAEILSKIG